MPRLRRLSAAIGLAALLAGTFFATAFAAQTYADQFFGVETAATSTQGTFAGVTSAPLTGAWQATIDHGLLPQAQGGSAPITGGFYTEDASVGGRPVKILGAFTGGAVTLESPPTAACGDQVYGIVASLAITAGGSPGTASLNGTLTHHRAVIFGSCQTYGAAVNGTVTFTF